MSAKRDKLDPLNFKEIMEYETLTKEGFDDLQDLIQDSKRPKYANIAYLAWIRAKREDANLSFDDYITNTSANQVVKDAFGNLNEDGEETEEAKKEEKSSPRGTRPKPDSA